MSALEEGAVLQTAEKLDPEGGQGPEGCGGFNPRIKPSESMRALAPEEMLTHVNDLFRDFLVANPGQQRLNLRLFGPGDGQQRRAGAASVVAVEVAGVLD